MTEPTTLAVTKEETVDVVAAKIRAFTANGELHFPPDYSPDNALKSAWLILQGTENKDHKPVLEICTRPSIANALLNMAVQGLNPAKQQGYFIAYGQTLTFQRSYHGTKAIALRVRPDIEDIVAQVIYEGDTFEYEIDRGRKLVTKHVQSLDNVDKAKTKGAYCTVIHTDGRAYSVIMTFDEIKAAWRMSQMHPVSDNGTIKEGSTHAKFTAEMAQKTVINRACKPLVNSSDDADLMLVEAFEESEQDAAEAEALEGIEAGANEGDVLPVPEPEESCTQRTEDVCADCKEQNVTCTDPRGPIDLPVTPGPGF